MPADDSYEKEQSMTNVTKTSLEEHRHPSAVSKRRASRLTSRWCKDPEGMLVIRWVIEAESDERRLSDALAA
jgi:hypothetical protein